MCPPDRHATGLSGLDWPCPSRAVAVRLRSLIFCAAIAAFSVTAIGAQAQTVAPAAPAEAAVDGALPVEAVEVVTPDVVPAAAPIDAAPEAAASIAHVDMIIEGELVSIRSRKIDDAETEYDLSDIAKPLRSKIEILDTLLGYHRFQDSAWMSIDMANGKVRSNKIVLGKLPNFEPREIADTWVDLNAVTVLTGTHATEDDQGRTVLTLDKRLRPQFGLELWVSGAPVDAFGNEPRTIGPILLVPLEPVVQALGHTVETANGMVTVRRTQDQATIELEIATGLVSVNGTARGVTPDMQFAEPDTLLLPFTAVETLTGTHIKLAPGSNRVDVRLDDRLSPTATPGAEVSDQVRATPFTPEALSFEISDRGPLRTELTSHWGAYNSRARLETNGGLSDLSSSQPAWMSLDVQSLEGWSGTVGDYNATYRELSSVGQNRIRGGAWRKQKVDGTIVAIAAGVPLSGSTIESDSVATPEFSGFTAGGRLISADQSQDVGLAASLEADGETGAIVAGGQKRFEFPENDRGLQSAYVAGDVGLFAGAESGADIRVRGSANYALTEQAGVSVGGSYDGAKFQSGAGRSEFATFDQRVGARTAVTGAAYWRSDEPWGALQHVGMGLRASWDHKGGDDEATNTSVAGSFSSQVGNIGPSVSAIVTRSAQSSDTSESTSTQIRVRALQRFDWGSATASYSRGATEGQPALQQANLSVQGRPLTKTLPKGARLAIAPSATMNWNGDDTAIRAGASLTADAGEALGPKLKLSGRIAALSSFDENTTGTRFFGNLQARYRVAKNLEITGIYADDFQGNRDLSVALRGVVTFNEPRRHRLPDSGKGILTGRVFVDKNRDGVRQDDEPGVGGVHVSVRGTRLGLRANRNGVFTIQNIKQGLYTVVVNRRSLPLGYMVPEDAEPRVTIGEGRRTDVDIPIILSGQVRGAVFIDDNANGAADPGERRLEGEWVRLTPLTGGEPMVIQSASFGQYGFENVAPGQYRLEVMIAGVPIRTEVDVTDDDPFIVAPVAIPPDVVAAGGGVDMSAGVLGQP